MNDVSPELLTLGITHDSSLALVLYLCWFIIMPEIKYVGALPFIILGMPEDAMQHKTIDRMASFGAF